MKVRSRTDGAARRLDDVERQLLNLLQGSFPLARRPFAAIGALAGIPEAEVIARTRQLLADRIIRQLTPIYDTRALGYASMLVAAKVDPEVPWRAATAINSHPGVSHNYLRDHEFNLWFTIAVAETRVSGWTGRSRRCSSSAARRRCANCRRCGSSRSAWISRWRAGRSG
jgi:siroheme decarboxylase